MKRIIYHIGASNGQNIPCYLLKADLVVVVEADFRLCDLIRNKFAASISEGRLVVENCAATHLGEGGEVVFHFHRKHSVLNQLPEPVQSDDPMLSPEMFQKMVVASRPHVEIVEQYGEPHYVKLDVERYDAILVDVLFRNNIFPSYLSAEAHRYDVITAITTPSQYDAFKIVNGATVAQDYQGSLIRAWPSGVEHRYSFPAGSAGPYGDDIQGDWLTLDELHTHFSQKGCGWKDVHARRAEL